MKLFKRKWLIFMMTLIVFCGVVTFTGCSCSSCNNDPSSSGTGNGDGSEDPANSIFSGEGTAYIFTEDYVLSQKDVKATNGTGNVVVLDYVCSFDLGGNALDLNGYTLQIVSQEEGCVIELEKGTIKNGTLDISVPNGDITFGEVQISENVAYALEAASSTIRFSNATISGKGKVKSESRVEIEYSSVQSITLEGNGTLNAGSGASLGSVEVSENASGASVSILNGATVSEMAISAAANVEIAGEVSSVTVNESVKATENVSVTVASTAKVDKVALKAAAKVDVAGEVGNVTVAETATSNEKAVEVNVSSTAKVQKLDVQAKAEVKVEGEVGSVLVNEKASGTKVNVSGAKASVANIVINSQDVKVESEKAETINKVVVAESVKDKVEISENVTVEIVTKEEIDEYFKHEHVYTLKVSKLPTCEEAGSATRVCDCGDQYEQILPAKGHNYASEITLLPTEKEEGVRKYTCINCKKSYTEKIPALGIKLESVAELIGTWIGDGTYSIVLEEGSSVVVFQDYFGDTDYPDNNYSYTLELTEAVIDVEDGYPTGYLTLVLSGEFFQGKDSVVNISSASAVTVTGDTEKHQAEVNIYLDGAYVYVDVVSDNQQFDSIVNSDVWFDNILRGMFGYGFTSDELLTLVDASNKLESYIVMYKPMVEKFFETVKNLDGQLEENGVLDVEAMSIFLEEYCLVVTKESNGDVTYELDLQKFADYLLEIGGMKGSEAFDEAYGENAFDTLMTELKTLPDMKLKGIADRVITISESYGIEVDIVFGTIETLAYEIYGVEIDIQAKLEAYYEKTLADILALSIKSTDGENTTAEEVKAQFNAACEQIKNYAATYTVDQLLNLYFYGQPNYIPNDGTGSQEVFSISKQLKAFVDAYNEATTVIITVNDGSLKAVELVLDELMRVEYANHAYTINMDYNGYQIILTGNVNSTVDKANLTIKQGEEVVYTSELKIDWENMKFESDLKNGETILGKILFELYENGAWESFDVEIAGVGNLKFHYNADNTYSLVGTYSDYEVSITSVVGSDEGEVVVVVKNGEEELYNGKVTLNVKEMTLEGFVKAADEVLAQIIADVNDKDSDHSIDTSVKVNEYTFDLEGSKEAGNLSAILKNGENEMFGATLQVTEGEGAVLVITYAGEEIAKIDMIGTEIEDFKTTIKYGTGEFTFVINVSVTELEDGVYEIKLDMPDAIREYNYATQTWVGYDVEAIYTVSLEETETAYSCKLDVYLASENAVLEDADKTLVLVDGSLTFSADKNAEGNVEILTLKANIDRYLGYAGYRYWQDERVYYENYATLNGTLTIDLESELVIEKEEAEKVVSNFDIFKEMNLTDGLSSLQYKESENGGYYVLCKRYSSYSSLTQNGGKYVGWVEYSTYTADIPAINGLPALSMLNYGEDCGDWYRVSLHYEGEMEYQSKRVYGTFERKTNDWGGYYYEIVEQESEEENGPSHPTHNSVSMYAYYNVGTKESAENSQHNYEYTGELLSGSIDCDDGIRVTETCVNCNNTYSWTSFGCSHVEKQLQTPKTQCGDMEVYEYACVCCGMGGYGYRNNNHSWEYHRNEAITADTLTALGFSAEGFYYGKVEESHCCDCGLERTQYTYYTHTAAKGCLRHSYVVYDYAGNEGYAAASATVSSVDYGHYKPSVYTDFTNNLIAEAKALIGRDLTFTPTSGYKTEEKCLGCGLTTYVHINMEDSEGKSIDIYQHYNEEGEFSRLYYRLYDLNYVVGRAGEYALANANSGNIEIYLNKDKVETDFNLYLYGDNGKVYIYGYKTYWRIETYDYENCRVVEKYVYFDENGNVTRTEVSDERESHDYSYTYYTEGACCTEDGRYYGARCTRCGVMDGGKYLDYSHYYTHYAYGTLSGYADYLTQSDNLGNATVSGYYCSLCYKMQDVTIVLQDNWTLQNHVYLYAEGIVIDFNGYTLDLNGYNFIVYGFDGSEVVFTDNTYDTSSPEGNDNGIVDSSAEESGCLVAFTDKGDITQGTIAMDVNQYLSDADNRDTIESSFMEAWEEPLDGYYALN